MVVSLFLLVVIVLHAHALPSPSWIITFEEEPSVVGLANNANITEGKLFTPAMLDIATPNYTLISSLSTFGEPHMNKTFIIQFTSGDSSTYTSDGSVFRAYEKSGYHDEYEILYVKYQSGVLGFGTSAPMYVFHSTGVDLSPFTEYTMALACSSDLDECTSWVSVNGTLPITAETDGQDFDGRVLSEAVVYSMQLKYPAASFNLVALYPLYIDTVDNFMEAGGLPYTPPSEPPTLSPTNAPSSSPTTAPSGSPTESPTSAPTTSPTESPTSTPTTSPTVSPTTSPSASPTEATECSIEVVTSGGAGLSWDLTDGEGDEEVASGEFGVPLDSFNLAIGEDYLLFLSSETLSADATLNVTVNGETTVLELPAGALASAEIAGVSCEDIVRKIAAADSSAYSLASGVLLVFLALLV